MDDLDDILAELDAPSAKPAKKKYSWMNPKNQLFPPPKNTSNLLDILDGEDEPKSLLKSKKSESMDLGYNDDFEDSENSPRSISKKKSPAFKKPSDKNLNFMNTEVAIKALEPETEEIVRPERNSVSGSRNISGKTTISLKIFIIST